MRAGIRGWFRLPINEPERTSADVDAELSAHVEARIAQLMAQGMTERAARAEAERRLGGLAHAHAELLRTARARDARLDWRERLRSWRDDVRYAGRSIVRERGYAAVVIITLALGIGANATVFGMVDRILLSGPAHIIAPGELRRISLNVEYDPAAGVQTFAPLNYPALVALREGVQSLRHLSAYMKQSLTLGAGPDALRLELGAVTASFFSLTGVQPVLGRFFDEREDAPPAGERVIVLSHALWRSTFGASRSVLGEEIELSGHRYTIVGVAPPGFTGVELEARDGWIPLSGAASLRMGADWTTNAGSFFMPIVGRLRDGASATRAAQEATRAWRAAYDGPAQPQREAYVTLAGIGTDGSGREPLETRVARWLLAVSGIVLLVACANVANLYFARGLRRRREIAVRLSLGISRGRLVRLLLLESLLLAVLGGIAALAVAHWGAELVRGVLLPHVDWTASPLNMRVLAVAAALTAFVGAVTGLAPAIQATRTHLTPSLTGSVHAPPAPGRARGVLVVVQAAFCVILLAGAGLFVRSLWNVQRMDLGLEADRVLALRLEWQTPANVTPEQRAELDARRAAFFADAVPRIAAQPGVLHASAAVGAAFTMSYAGALRAEGIDSIPRLPGGGPYLSAVSAGYFATLGTRVLRGREFVPGEGAGTEPVAIVSRTMAETLWPGADPLGRCIYVGGGEAPCSRVVGVVADVRRFQIVENEAMQYYVPLGQQAAWMSGPSLLVRTAGPPERYAEPLRMALYALEPALRYVNAVPFSEILNPQRRPWTLGATLFAICGALALLIALVGLYSVIAYLVLHRRHEIGVRRALGAGRVDIMRMIVRQVLLLAGVGTASGVIVALLAAPALEPLLFETQPRDIYVIGVVTSLLLGAALAAGIGPALAASRVPPTQALRET